MPYITEAQRDELGDYDPRSPQNAGELNYLISMLIEQYRDTVGESYQTYNDVMGALEGAKLELYRKLIGPYEDAKTLTNGEIPGHADLPWAAGFFDGEGCMRYYCNNPSKKAPKGRIQLGVVQKEPLLLLRFKEAVGNIGYIRQIKQHKTERQYWHYNVTKYADIEHVSAVLWPHLGQFKRRDVLDALTRYGQARDWDLSTLPEDIHSEWPEPQDVELSGVVT